MAAIDPDAVPEFEDEAHANKAPRATLKIIRPPPGLDYEDSADDEDDEDDESDDEANGGPSDPARKKRAMLEAALKNMDDGMDEDDEDEDDDDEDTDLAAAISKLVKGKGRATDDDDSDSDEDLELEEVVICTLDPERVCLFSLPKGPAPKISLTIYSTINKLWTSLSAKASASFSKSPALTPFSSPETTSLLLKTCTTVMRRARMMKMTMNTTSLQTRTSWLPSWVRMTRVTSWTI